MASFHKTEKVFVKKKKKKKKAMGGRKRPTEVRSPTVTTHT